MRLADETDRVLVSFCVRTGKLSPLPACADQPIVVGRLLLGHSGADPRNRGLLPGGLAGARPRDHRPRGC